MIVCYENTGEEKENLTSQESVELAPRYELPKER